MKADMKNFTLHDLQSLDAVVRLGGFQAAATALHRSHPAVFAAVARLEQQLGVALLDRSGYRVRPNAAGASFLHRAQALLREHAALQAHATHLAAGEESEIHIALGDLCPQPWMLGALSRFFAACPQTRLHLHFETVGGPLERLLDGAVDLIVHRIAPGNPQLAWIELCPVRLVPVIAPGVLPAATQAPVSPAQLLPYTQCVMRDSARHSTAENYFLLEGAVQCTVPDQRMKKEVILQGLGWGHLPHFLIEDELRDGRLVSLANPLLPGTTETLVVARLQSRPLGPVATRLWSYLQQAAPALRAALATPG